MNLRDVRPAMLAKPNNPFVPAWISTVTRDPTRQTSAVLLHCKETRHSFNNTDLVILDLEEDCVRRGIKEAIWERVEQPSLNRKGGLRFSLSDTWDRVLRRFPSRLSRDLSRSRDLQHKLMNSLHSKRFQRARSELFARKPHGNAWYAG